MHYYAVPVGSLTKSVTSNPSTDVLPFFNEVAKDMADPAVLDLAGLFVSPLTAFAYDGDKVGSGFKANGNNCKPIELFL